MGDKPQTSYRCQYVVLNDIVNVLETLGLGVEVIAAGCDYHQP